MLWTAAAPDQVSGPYEAARHGLYTDFAVGALRGWADGEIDGRRDGAVTSQEAGAYVSRALKSLQVRFQTPVLDAPGNWTLSSGQLEVGPDITTLPRPSSPSTPSLGPIVPPQQPERSLIGPVEHIGGAVYSDASNAKATWTDVSRLANTHPSGQLLRTKRSGNSLAQAATVLTSVGASVAGMGLIATASGWSNRSHPKIPKMYAAGGTLMGVSVGGAIGEFMLMKQRRRNRQEIEVIANEVLRHPLEG